jgi:Uma2 family endonuclease
MEPYIENIPAYLIREVVNGKNYYYKNFHKVTEENSSLESIIGISELQATLVSTIFKFLSKLLDNKTYKLVTNEVGLHLSANNNFSNDISIYKRDSLAKDRDYTKYFSVAPFIAFEVDIKIKEENKEADDFSYMVNKSAQMINAGTEKVIWVLTQIQSSVIFEKVADGSIQPKIISWKNSFDILSAITIEIEAWLIEDGEEDLLQTL